MPPHQSQYVELPFADARMAEVAHNRRLNHGRLMAGDRQRIADIQRRRSVYRRIPDVARRGAEGRILTLRRPSMIDQPGWVLNIIDV